MALILVIWAVSGATGVALVRSAWRERESASRSRLRKVYDEARFRVRMTAGILLILWLLSGVIWVIVNWL